MSVFGRKNDEDIGKDVEEEKSAQPGVVEDSKESIVKKKKVSAPVRKIQTADFDGAGNLLFAVDQRGKRFTTSASLFNTRMIDLFAKDADVKIKTDDGEMTIDVQQIKK